MLIADSPPLHWASRLPSEVYDQIIDAVADLRYLRPLDFECDPRGLRICALVCRSWLPRSRRRLYYHIQLSEDLQNRQLITTLSISPTLGCLVKELGIHQRFPAEGSGWIHRAVISLPPFLRHLKALSLAFLPAMHPTFPLLCSQFNSVQELKLSYLSHPIWSFREVVQIVNRFPRLRHLTLNCCRWLKPAYYFGGRRLRLAALRVYNECGEDILQWLLTSHSSSNLTTLEWSYRMHNEPDVDPSLFLQALVKSCACTLQSLSLPVGLRYFPEHDTPSLFSTTALRRLHICYIGLGNALSHLSRLSIIGPHTLQVLRITFLGSFSTTFTSDLGTSLEGVDTALSNPNFVKLRKVELVLQQEHTLDGVASTLETMLPRSYTNGLLWVRPDLMNLDGVTVRIGPFFHIAPDSIRRRFPQFSDWEPYGSDTPP